MFGKNICATIGPFFTGLRGRFSVFAVQKHRNVRRSQKREVFTTPLSPVKLCAIREFGLAVTGHGQLVRGRRRAVAQAKP